MNLFITGSTGFIGSYVLSQALMDGHHVLAHRRSSNSQPSVTLKSKPTWIEKPLNFIDETDLQNIDAVIHLAATGVSPRIAPWEELKEVNIDATMNMCCLARVINASILISGSYAEYGLSGLRYDKIPANAPLEPTFPYAASKAAASILALSYARSEKITLSYLRIFNAFGLGQHITNLWPSMRRAALDGENFPMTAGEQIRDFVKVEDVARLILQEVQFQSRNPQSIRVRNIGSGQPQTIRSFCEGWWNYWNAPGQLQVGAVEYRQGEVMRYVPEL